MIPIGDITGLVLSGGRGSRMGGVDKGLQPHLGVPLALHALSRLSPQVGQTMISANRHLAEYRAMGVPVWPDSMGAESDRCADSPGDARADAAAVALADIHAHAHAGPLAGILAGLGRCDTPWLVTVPCDSPCFPTDLVARLAQSLQAENADIAIAATRVEGIVVTQPVFCLMKASLRASLLKFTRSGQRKVDTWTAQHRRIQVLFDDPHVFVNANTLAELQQLQTSTPSSGPTDLAMAR